MAELTGNVDLLARLDERTERMDKFIHDYIQRTDKRLDDHDDCIVDLKCEQVVIKDRVKVANGLQAAWSALLMAVATFLGTQK